MKGRTMPGGAESCGRQRRWHSGGSALDRAQLLRGDGQALNLAWTQAKVLPFWRGRPLTEGEGDSKTLAWLPSAHPLFATTTAPIFLGQDGGQDGGHPCFAVDISATLTAPSAPPAGPFDTARQPHPALPPTQGFADLRAVMAVLSPRQAELVAMAKALLNGTAPMASAPPAAWPAPSPWAAGNASARPAARRISPAPIPW